MRTRTAGATVYLQEELSDARLRCDELKGYIVRAFDLVNSSSKKDHLYAVAGDIIYAVPQTLLKLERALEASAMAVNKIDYEELRQILRPEKVDELERVLDEVRLRMPKRTGTIQWKMPDYNDEKIKGSLGPKDTYAEGQMEAIWKEESLEAATLPDAIEMYAWDLGYQKHPLPDWLIYLGKKYKVDVISNHKDGQSSGE